MGKLTRKVRKLKPEKHKKVKKGAILADSEILRALKDGTIIIEPFNRENLGSNSYDVRLGDTLKVYTSKVLDAKKQNRTRTLKIPKEGIELKPGIVYLASTIEYTETRGYVPFIEGKSSIGRLGIDIHATAGKGDDGFCGEWTLEISVTQKVRVYAGMKIGQLIYFTLEGITLVPYDKKPSAKYNYQRGPTESQNFKNFKHVV